MGIHPALALVPIVPLLPHEARRRELFADRLDRTPIHHAEHEWNGIAQIALFLFGLVNAGVILRHVDTGTWAVLVAAMLGRPAGIFIALGLAMTAGLRLPGRMHGRDLIVAALAMTSGFTFALFVNSAALPTGAVASQIALGALATVAGVAVTMIAARLLAAGRFSRQG
jgi:NhaA family Na+:H+ antiporter